MSGASRSAERIAGRDVDHMARAAIASASTAHVSHSGLASAVYWAVLAVRAAPASEPQSATPILTPTWRLVDATAEAAPARSVGMPLTAVGDPRSLTSQIRFLDSNA
jgi:hypothetical protein